MKKAINIITSLALAFGPTVSLAGDKPSLISSNNQKWEEVEIQKGFTVSRYLRLKGCSNIWNKYVPMVKEKNPQIKDINVLEVGDKINMPLCGKENKVVYFFEEDDLQRTDKIYDWENVITPEGFILSAHLYYKNNCLNIWDKQIPEFVKVNPSVKNPDIISIGKKIKVQKCLKEEPKNYVEVEQKVAEPPVEILDEHRFEVFAGLFKEDQANAEVGVGINVLGSLSDNLGYRMFLVGASSAAIYFANAEFRTKPAVMRYYLSAGLGQRLSLSNDQIDRIDDGVDSFVHTGVGFIYQPKGTFYLKMEAGLNVAPRFSPNIEVSAMKKFNSFWLGGFIQLKSTRSIVDETEDDRRYIFTGIKASF